MAGRRVPHVTRIRRDLDFLVAHGLLERRLRPDGQVGYWPTALAYAMDAVPSTFPARPPARAECIRARAEPPEAPQVTQMGSDSSTSSI